MQGLQVVNFFSTGLGGTAFEALTPGTGDSATFFNVPIGSPAFLAEIWGVDDSNSCELSLTATRFHDQVFGIRTQLPDGSALAPAGRASLVSPGGFDQPVYPSDVLTVQAAGQNGDNVNVTFIMYYQDIPGIAAALAGWDAVKAAMKNLVGIHVSLTPGSGDWGASVALNAADNRLHANTFYAVLGFTSDIPCAAIGLSGIDTGNLRVGGPVLADPEHDAYLFADLAKAYQASLIPVINSNNAGSTNLQAADPSGSAVELDVILAELTRQV